MSAASSVVLYGNSLILAGIEAELRSRGQYNVVVIASNGDAAARIGASKPAAVVFDLAAGQPDFAFVLLRERPDLLLIGLDPGGDRLLVLSEQPARDLTTEDLVRLIQSWTTTGRRARRPGPRR